jgi:hypothetical protein
VQGIVTPFARTSQRREHGSSTDRRHSNLRLTPNGWRLSGERSEAERVRCSRGFGESLLVRRNMAGRYACTRMLFNGPELRRPEAVEPEGPGAPAARSLPAPARTERKHDAGPGQTAGGFPPGPSHFSRVAERLAAQRRAQASPLKPRVMRPRGVCRTGTRARSPRHSATRLFRGPVRR